MEKQHKQQKGISRRHFLGLGAGLSAGLIMPQAFAASHPAVKQQGERRLSLYNTHTGEKVSATYWENGIYIPDGMKEIEWLLRDHRAGKHHAMDKRLLDMLHAIQCKTECNQPFHIISGYRSPKTNAMLRGKGSGGVAKKSFHMQGRAIDIRIPRFDTSKLRKAAMSLKGGGVGYYSRSNFVHLDTGRVRAWGK